MVPVIAGSGRSFEGAFLYYFHDKKALTTARVAWTQTINMLTEQVEKAWKVMAYTAKHQDRLKEASGQKRTGAKLEKPVFAYSLSWHPEQNPTQEIMLEAAQDSLKALGLEEHQAMIAAHKDEPQPHVHIVVNTVHPFTGLVAKLKYTKRKLSDFAREFQRKEGTDYCPKREENYQKRQQGKNTQYGDPAIIEAWEQSKDGAGFEAALAKQGYQLARGRKRLVVVDRYGKTINPVRMLPGVKSKDFKARLKDIDAEHLPTAEEAAQRIHQQEDKQEGSDQRFEERMIEAVNNQHFKHSEERHKAFAYHTKIIETKRAELSSYYKLDAKQKQIAKLEKQIEKSGFWQKLFRRDVRKKEKLNVLKANQANAHMRFDEAITGLEHARDHDMHNLTARHAKEREILLQRLEGRRSQERPAQQDISQNNRNIGHNGPSLGR